MDVILMFPSMGHNNKVAYVFVVFRLEMVWPLPGLPVGGVRE